MIWVRYLQFSFGLQHTTALIPQMLVARMYES